MGLVTYHPITKTMKFMNRTSSSLTPRPRRWKVRRVLSNEQFLKYTQDQVPILLKALWSRILIKLYYDNEQSDFSKLKSVWSTISLAPCPSVGCWRGWRCSSTPWPSYSPCLREVGSGDVWFGSWSHIVTIFPLSYKDFTLFKDLV